MVKIIKLKFITPVRFGNSSSLESNSQIHICSDTFLSALFVNNLDYGEKLVNLVEKDMILISDAFPYVEDDLLIPKPIMNLTKEKSLTTSPTFSKNLKKLNFIPLSSLSKYKNGFDDENEINRITNIEKNIGLHNQRINLQYDEDPYYVSNFVFQEKSGLYILIKYNNDEDFEEFKNNVENLGFNGIGGRKSSGFGKFIILEINDFLYKNDNSDLNLLLSTFYPDDDELDCLDDEGNTFSLLKRSGIILERNFSKKKRSIYAIKSGGTFKQEYHGKIIIQESDYHPIYRFLKGVYINI
jgi:CRISPR-associated protein Csm4